MKTTFVTQTEFDELLDYSCSLPTGTVIGKRWKRSNAYARPKEPITWMMGEYYDIDDPESVGIRWTHLKVARTYALHVICTSPAQSMS